MIERISSFKDIPGGEMLNIAKEALKDAQDIMQDIKNGTTPPPIPGERRKNFRKRAIFLADEALGMLEQLKVVKRGEVDQAAAELEQEVRKFILENDLKKERPKPVVKEEKAE